MIDIAIHIIGEHGVALQKCVDHEPPARGDTISDAAGVLLVVHRRWSRDLQSMDLTCERMKQEPKP